jgi:glycosyltransferase involved in cell wall biosynthesis
MQNVLLITTELGVGGAEKALTEIALRMPNLGYSPTVVSLKPRPASGRDQLVLRLEDAHLAVRFLDTTRPHQFFSATRKLRAILGENGAAVALSFLFHANLLTALAIGGRSIRHFAGIRVAEPNRWRNRLEALVLRRATGVICVSKSVAKHFGQFFGDSRRIEVIPNGIDPFGNIPPIDLSNLGVGPEAQIILFIGRLHPQKGLDWAIQNLDRVMEEHSNLHLIIVGDGPQSETLEQTCLNKHFSERVHFLGFQEETASFLARARCLLLPSRWEGLPNVILEAMAAGKPVIASHLSAADELFSADVASSQVFRFGNADDFVEKLSCVVTDDALAARLGTANRTQSEKFSWDTIAAHYARRLAAID